MPQRDLPSWAQRAVDDLRAPSPESRARYAHFAHGSARHLPLYALFVAGLALTLWALFDLRTAQVVPWRWAGGIALVLASAAALAARSRAQVRLPDGAVLAPEGLLWVEGARYRVLPRGSIRAASLEGGALSVAHDDGAWVLMTATPGTTQHEQLAGRRAVIERWLPAGELPEGSRLLPPFPDRRPAVIFAKHAAAAVGVSLFFWLVAVLPATSDAGETVRTFVEALAADDLDGAYELLAPRTRQRLGRETFSEQLPTELRRATGIDINSVRGGVGTVVGASTCVDGYLDGLEGYSGFSFGLVETQEGLRIESWRSGQCR